MVNPSLTDTTTSGTVYNTWTVYVDDALDDEQYTYEIVVATDAGEPTIDLSAIDYDWDYPEEIVEKLKWKDITFRKSKPSRVINVRRDVQGKSGRW